MTGLGGESRMVSYYEEVDQMHPTVESERTATPSQLTLSLSD